MNCEQLNSLLESIPLSGFSPEQRMASEEHALGCANCQDLLREEQELETLLHKAPALDIPNDLSSSVMHTISQQENARAKGRALPPAQDGEWPISMIVVGFAITVCIYSYELINGRSTAFNLFSLWTRDWSQWLFQPIQLNLIGALIATGFLSYLAGFLMMSREKQL